MSEQPTKIQQTEFLEFSISHLVSKGWSMKEFHFHSGCEIYLSLSDGLQFFVNNRLYPVKKGDLLVFNRMDLHRAIVPEELSYERYYLLFDETYIHDLSSPDTDLLNCFFHRKKDFIHLIHLTEEQQVGLIGLLEMGKANLAVTAGYGTDLKKKMALADILLFINLLYQEKGRKTPVLKSNYSKKVAEIQKYILSNLNACLSLTELSKRFYISKRHLEHLFSEHCHFSVGEYVISMRIIHARELLRNGATVAEAGETVGYLNPSHFSRMFKQHTGVSPKQYALATRS